MTTLVQIDTLREYESNWVIKQRFMSGSRVVNYVLDAFRYLVTGIVAMLLALLLVLLIVEVGAVIGAALEHDKLASRNWGESAMWANPQAKAMAMSR